MTSRQVAKYWKYCNYDYISGFPILKLAGMQFFEFLTQIHRQKLNFEPRFEKKFILKLEQQRLLSIWSCRLSENYFLNGYLCFFVFLYANEKSQVQFAVIGTKNALPHHPNYIYCVFHRLHPFPNYKNSEHMSFQASSQK